MNWWENVVIPVDMGHLLTCFQTKNDQYSFFRICQSDGRMFVFENVLFEGSFEIKNPKRTNQKKKRDKLTGTFSNMFLTDKHQNLENLIEFFWLNFREK